MLLDSSVEIISKEIAVHVSIGPNPLFATTTPVATQCNVLAVGIGLDLRINLRVIDFHIVTFPGWMISLLYNNWRCARFSDAVTTLWLSTIPLNRFPDKEVHLLRIFTTMGNGVGMG